MYRAVADVPPSVVESLVELDELAAADASSAELVLTFLEEKVNFQTDVRQPKVRDLRGRSRFDCRRIGRV